MNRFLTVQDYQKENQITIHSLYHKNLKLTKSKEIMVFSTTLLQYIC